MTIYQRMEEVFRVADVHGYYQAWRKTEDEPTLPDCYATYTVTKEHPAQCADDREAFRRYHLLIRVYGVSDITLAVDNLLDALELDGFAVVDGGDDYSTLNGEHQYVKNLHATYVDFGEWGENDA